MQLKTKNLLQVRTPEGVTFHLHLASPLLRFMAWFIDLFVLIVALNSISFVIQMLAVLSENIAIAMNVILYFIITIGYGITCEWFLNGQTFGKKLFRIRVVDDRGLKLRFSQVVMRNLLRTIDSMPLLYLVGGMSMMLNKRYQRLGDLTAGTVVIRLRETEEPDLKQLMHGKYNSLRDWPHLIARLRQRIGPDDVAVALEALMRRPHLENQARLKIFANLATHFRNEVAIPEPLLEGISDEQFVANVVEVLYRSESTRQNKPKQTQPAEAPNLPQPLE